MRVIKKYDRLVHKFYNAVKNYESSFRDLSLSEREEKKERMARIRVACEEQWIQLGLDNLTEDGNAKADKKMFDETLRLHRQLLARNA